MGTQSLAAKVEKDLAHPPLQASQEAPWAPGMAPIRGQPYRLLECKGLGGFGEVWSAAGPAGFPVALKRVRAEFGHSLANSHSRHELGALAVMMQVRHANLVAIHGAFFLRRGDLVEAHHSPDELVIVMELGDHSLSDRLAECRKQGLPGIPAPELLEYMWEAAKALDYLAAQQLTVGSKTGKYAYHGDVKPSNLLLIGGSVAIADFSLVGIMRNTSTKPPQAYSPPYVDPVYVLEKKLDKRSDQFSLAVTFYQLLTGLLPFERNSLDESTIAAETAVLDLEVLQPYRAALGKALRKKPDERFRNCLEFVSNLAGVGARWAPVGTAHDDELLTYAEQMDRLGGRDGIDAGYARATVDRNGARKHQQCYAQSKSVEPVLVKAGLEFVLIPPATIKGNDIAWGDCHQYFYISKTARTMQQWSELVRDEGGLAYLTKGAEVRLRHLPATVNELGKLLKVKVRLPTVREWVHAFLLGLIDLPETYSPEEICMNSPKEYSTARWMNDRERPVISSPSLPSQILTANQFWRVVLETID